LFQGGGFPIGDLIGIFEVFGHGAFSFYDVFTPGKQPGLHRGKTPEIAHFGRARNSGSYCAYDDRRKTIILAT
jgi:hypothetical protein